MYTEAVTIIGAGPTGIAAAIQLKRWGLTPLLLERDHLGGLVRNANLVENYPGFPEGISGPDLIALFQAQINRIGVAVTFEAVRLLDWDGVFRITTDHRTVDSQIVVAASGTKPSIWQGFDIPSYLSDRFLYEVYPLSNVAGQRIAIIGAGDAAFDYALNLARQNRVTILNRAEKSRCLPLLWQRASKMASITHLPGTTVTGVNNTADTPILKCNGPQGDWELVADYVIFAIGREPQSDYLSQTVIQQMTELKQKQILYLAGDVKNEIYRQATIAIGDGIRTAMRICRTLEEAD